VPARVFAVWCATCVLWSSTFLFLRIGVGEIPPLTFASLRLAIALAVLLPLALARKWLVGLAARECALTAGSGLLILGVNYALLFWAAQFIPSGLVAILQSATPVVALALGWFLGSEEVTARKLAAFAIAFVGVAVIFSDEAAVPRGTAALASTAVLVGSCSLVIGYVLQKTYGRRLSPAPVITIQTAAAAVPLLAGAIVFEGSVLSVGWSPAAVAALLYLGVVASVIAFALNYWLLRRIDASLMLLMGVAEVPLAVALGVLVLHEPLHPLSLVGATFVALGVALIARR
jgi:drug/metabolite transporter (DMT)-like permease